LTYKHSIECIEAGTPILVFPEYSDEGYKDMIEKFWPGFIYVLKLYYKKHGVDLPVYALRYDPKKLVYGKPMYYREISNGRTDEEALDVLRDYMNSLKEVTEK